MHVWSLLIPGIVLGCHHGTCEVITSSELDHTSHYLVLVVSLCSSVVAYYGQHPTA